MSTNQDRLIPSRPIRRDEAPVDAWEERPLESAPTPWPHCGWYPPRGCPARCRPSRSRPPRPWSGREPGCDILLSDGSVSRKHAKIERRGPHLGRGGPGKRQRHLRRQPEDRRGRAQERAGAALRDGGASGWRSPRGPRRHGRGQRADDATVLADAGSAPVAPRPAGPPPIPKASPPRPPRRLPPSAAAAKERFRGGAAPACVPRSPDVAPPPPAKKGRGPFFWIGTGCCGCLAPRRAARGRLLGGLAFCDPGPGERGADDPATGQERRPGRGLRRARLPPKAEMSREEFEALVEAPSRLKNNGDSTFLSRWVDERPRRLGGTLTPAGGGRAGAGHDRAPEGGRRLEDHAHQVRGLAGGPEPDGPLPAA